MKWASAVLTAEKSVERGIGRGVWQTHGWKLKVHRASGTGATRPEAGDHESRPRCQRRQKFSRAASARTFSNEDPRCAISFISACLPAGNDSIFSSFQRQRPAADRAEIRVRPRERRGRLLLRGGGWAKIEICSSREVHSLAGGGGGHCHDPGARNKFSW